MITYSKREVRLTAQSTDLWLRVEDRVIDCNDSIAMRIVLPDCTLVYATNLDQLREAVATLHDIDTRKVAR